MAGNSVQLERPEAEEVGTESIGAEEKSAMKR